MKIILPDKALKYGTSPIYLLDDKQIGYVKYFFSSDIHKLEIYDDLNHMISSGFATLLKPFPSWIINTPANQEMGKINKNIIDGTFEYRSSSGIKYETEGSLNDNFHLINSEDRSIMISARNISSRFSFKPYSFEFTLVKEEFLWEGISIIQGLRSLKSYLVLKNLF